MPSDRVLREYYRRGIAEELARGTPRAELLSFQQYKRTYRIWLRLANSDRGGDVQL